MAKKKNNNLGCLGIILLPFYLLFLPFRIMYSLLNLGKVMKLRLITCIIIVCATMYLLVPKAFSLNPLVTIGKTFNLVENYQ